MQTHARTHIHTYTRHAYAPPHTTHTTRVHTMHTHAQSLPGGSPPSGTRAAGLSSARSTDHPGRSAPLSPVLPTAAGSHSRHSHPYGSATLELCSPPRPWDRWTLQGGEAVASPNEHTAQGDRAELPHREPCDAPMSPKPKGARAVAKTRPLRLAVEAGRAQGPTPGTARAGAAAALGARLRARLLMGPAGSRARQENARCGSTRRGAAGATHGGSLRGGVRAPQCLGATHAPPLVAQSHVTAAELSSSQPGPRCQLTAAFKPRPSRDGS